MGAAVGPLIASLREAIPLQVRSAPTSNDYLEGVLARADLERCQAMLQQALGPAAKEFGQPPAFKRELQGAVEMLGGVWVEQCLFLSPIDAQTAIYAVLWPWRSDPTRITLKVGVTHLT